MQQILLAFVALFVAVDILGVLPLYLSLTSQMSREARSKLSFQSTLTATAVGLGFLIVGNLIFWVMGVISKWRGESCSWSCRFTTFSIRGRSSGGLRPG